MRLKPEIIDLIASHGLPKGDVLTLAEVATHLGKSTSAIERAARKLRDAGRLRYVGPQKGGRWEVMP